jgi:hypothetical protein
MCRGNGAGKDAAGQERAKKPSGGGDEEEGRIHGHGEEEREGQQQLYRTAKGGRTEKQHETKAKLQLSRVRK